VNIKKRLKKNVKAISRVHLSFLSQTKQDEGINMTAKDKRERVRISISRGVDFVVKGRAYRSSIENTSGGGVFIKTARRFSDRYKEQDISMTIESPSEKRTGKIARVAPHGIGVEFN
jgi:hypothetical protein